MRFSHKKKELEKKKVMGSNLPSGETLTLNTLRVHSPFTVSQTNMPFNYQPKKNNECLPKKKKKNNEY